ITFFRALPKLPRVASLEWHHVFLRLMYEDSESFLQHLIRTHRYRHFYLLNIPFLPSAFVEPEPAVVEPFITRSLDSLHRFEYNIEAYNVRSVRIGEVAGAIDLVRLYFSQEFDRDLYILFAHRLLLNGSGFIERKIEEVYIVVGNANVSACSSRLAAANESLYRTNVRRIDLV